MLRALVIVSLTFAGAGCSDGACELLAKIDCSKSKNRSECEIYKSSGAASGDKWKCGDLLPKDSVSSAR